MFVKMSLRHFLVGCCSKLIPTTFNGLMVPEWNQNYRKKISFQNVVQISDIKYCYKKRLLDDEPEKRCIATRDCGYFDI